MFLIGRWLGTKVRDWSEPRYLVCNPLPYSSTTSSDATPSFRGDLAAGQSGPLLVIFRAPTVQGLTYVFSTSYRGRLKGGCQRVRPGVKGLQIKTTHDNYHKVFEPQANYEFLQGAKARSLEIVDFQRFPLTTLWLL